jgi:chromosome segregation ATPase
LSFQQTLADEVEAALKELSSALLYSQGSLTELEDRVSRFEQALEHLRTARQELDQGITRLQETDSQFPTR